MGVFSYFCSMKNESDLLVRITTDPKICHGKPVIRGLRYPVENILELLASGMTQQDILNDYEDLEEADLQAALLFAARAMRMKHVTPLAA